MAPIMNLASTLDTFEFGNNRRGNALSDVIALVREIATGANLLAYQDPGSPPVARPSIG